MAEDYTWQDKPVTGVTALAARVAALERENAELRARLDATDTRAEGWRTSRDNLRSIREEQRQRIAELKARWGAVPWVALSAVLAGVDDISDYNQASAWVDANRPQGVQP